MKNQQKGFLIASMIAIVLILSIGGGTYVYLESKKVELAIKEDAKVSTSTNTVDNTSATTQENTTTEASSNNANEEEVIVSNSTTTVDSTATTTQENTTLATSSKIETLNNLENNIKSNNTTDLWSNIDKETLALKNKDVESIKKLYYIQPTAEESSQLKELFPYLLEQNTKMNKSDYVNIWQDEKQAIYTTGLLKDNKPESYGYKKGIIIFVNDKGGWKILSKNELVWSVPSTTTTDGPKITQAEADKSLKEMVIDIDKDKDGLTDNEETCSGNFKNNKDCKKTDPNKRDTSGDGWWDGINKAMTDRISR